MKQLLVEKYRPSSLDEYAFTDGLEEVINGWVKEQYLPNVLFSSGPGTGKSTLARLLINEFDIDKSDVWRVNMSVHSGVGFIRDELESWLKKSPLGDIKVAVLEEMDRLSPDAQKALRAVTEDFSDSCRFIGTANYPQGLIPELQSRFQHIKISSPDYETVIDIVCNIVDQENIVFKYDEDLLSHVDLCYPDIRKIINSIDQNTVISEDAKTLNRLTDIVSGVDVSEWDAIWNDGKVVEKFDDVLALCELVDKNNVDWFYTVMYNNIHNFGGESEDKARALVLLSQYLFKSQNCANQRLHLEAFLYNAFVLEE